MFCQCSRHRIVGIDDFVVAQIGRHSAAQPAPITSSDATMPDRTTRCTIAHDEHGSIAPIRHRRTGTGTGIGAACALAFARQHLDASRLDGSLDDALHLNAY